MVVRHSCHRVAGPAAARVTIDGTATFTHCWAQHTRTRFNVLTFHHSFTHSLSLSLFIDPPVPAVLSNPSHSTQVLDLLSSSSSASSSSTFHVEGGSSIRLADCYRASKHLNPLFSSSSSTHHLIMSSRRCRHVVFMSSIDSWPISPFCLSLPASLLFSFQTFSSKFTYI